MLNRVIPKPTRLNSESQKARVKLGLEVVDTLGDYRPEKLGPLQYYSSAPTGSNPGIEIWLHSWNGINTRVFQCVVPCKCHCTFSS